MEKIFVVADLHGHIEFHKINEENFEEQKDLTKDDYLIVAGDFGLVWSESLLELAYLNILNNKNFTTLFVAGNHENFDLLKQYPIVDFKGGKARKIKSSVYQLLNGEIYNIAGKKIFVMGGAVSIDKHLRKEGVSWWAEEEPSKEEYDNAISNLEDHDYKVDYVLTHTGPTDVLVDMGFLYDKTEICRFLNFLNNNLEYDKWVFGHLHKDIDIGKHSLIYNRVIRLV